MRLKPATFQLLKFDWAGGEKDWPLRDWLQCLTDWLTNGSGFFQGYSSLSPEDQAIFDALTNSGQRIVTEIESLKKTFSQSAKHLLPNL